MRELVLIVVTVTGCSATAKAPANPSPAEVAAEAAPEADVLNRTWIVDKHIIVKGSSIEAGDAKGFHGRTIDITSTGFVSPWQGTCASASRTLERRDLASVITELGIKPGDQPALERFGFGDDIAEFRLRCNDRESAPPFLVYVSNAKAMTCYGGACYLLIQF